MNNEVSIRHVEIEDAYDLLETMKKIDSESAFMLRKKGERQTSLEEQVSIIKNVLSKRNKMTFVATIGDRIVGYLRCWGGDFSMSRHVAALVVGVLMDFTNQGIGTQLLTEAEDWARNSGIHRIELRVHATNDAAIHLYEKMGFEKDGVAKDAATMNGKFVDMNMMSKIL